MFLMGGAQYARRHRLACAGERVRPAQEQVPTPRATERQNHAFIRDSGLTRGQGETPGCGQIAVNVLGIRASGLRYYRRLGRLRKARREDGSTINTMMRTNPTTVSVAATCRAGFGAPTTPPAASSRLSTEPIMVSQMPHFLSLHKPMAPTRPAAPSTTAK